jgi:malonyl-CoA decarboxylase
VRREESAALHRAAPTDDADGGAALLSLLKGEAWWEDPEVVEALRRPLVRLCALHLTSPAGAGRATDPVARFHLGNGARLERINWLGNVAPRGITESFGLMVNYLYDPDTIEANHEVFARDGTVMRSPAIDALLAPAPAAVANVRSRLRLH